MLRNSLASTVLLLLTLHVQAVETPPVVELFSCNYNDGQDADDLESAVEYWQGQIKNVEGSENYFAAIFSPIRAVGPYDVHWVGVSPNLNEWAENTNRLISSKEGRSSQERFDSVVTCDSGLFFSTNIFQERANPPTAGRSGVVETFHCKLPEGKTMVNVTAVEQAWAAAATGVVKLDFFRWVPVWANIDYDVVYIVGHDDLKSFATNNTALFNSPELGLASELLTTVTTCKGGLYAVDYLLAPQTLQNNKSTKG